MCNKAINIKIIKNQISQLVRNTKNFSEQPLYINGQVFSVRKKIALKLFHNDWDTNNFMHNSTYKNLSKKLYIYGLAPVDGDFIVSSDDIYLVPKSYIEPYTSDLHTKTFKYEIIFKAYKQPIPKPLTAHMQEVIDTLNNDAPCQSITRSFVNSLTDSLDFTREHFIYKKSKNPTKILTGLQQLLRKFHNTALNILGEEILTSLGNQVKNFKIVDANNDLYFDYRPTNVTSIQLDQNTYKISLDGKGVDRLSFHYIISDNESKHRGSLKIKKDLTCMAATLNYTLAAIRAEDSHITDYLSRYNATK